MRQEAHSCFAQMDRSLALPKIRARVLQQQFQTAWREAEFLKLDQALAAPELQVGWLCLASRLQRRDISQKLTPPGPAFPLALSFLLLFSCLGRIWLFLQPPCLSRS
jgi:hypothetical protein